MAHLSLDGEPLLVSLHTVGYKEFETERLSKQESKKKSLDLKNLNLYLKTSMLVPEIYIQSAPNNSNETHSFICLGRAGNFGQH